MNSGYSVVILSALRQLGLGAHEVRRATGLSEASLKSVVAGKREFSDIELKRIEHTTGKTTGQLGAMVIEPTGGKFSDLMESWAEFSRTSASAQTMKDRDPGRSRAFGFVETSSDAKLQAALTVVAGTVKKAHPREKRGCGGR